MSFEPVLAVSNLSKCYQMYAKPQDRLKQAIFPKLQRAAYSLARVVFPIRAVPRQYCRDFWALRDVSFEMGEGETLGIIGRNGSGKSTLLQLICGTLHATHGEVKTRGRIAALLELGAGFNPEFTGCENVYLNASILGLSKEEIDAKYEDIVKFADIGEFIDQPVKTYSSGMYVRLAFAVVTHVDADVLIIDEALAVGDAFFSQKCLRWLRNFKQTGTILFVSHDTGAVITLCDRAIWLDLGMVKAMGPAKDVCESYLSTLYAEAIGLQPEKAVTGKVARSHDQPKEARGYPPKVANPKVGQPLASLMTNLTEAFQFNFNSSYFGSGDATIFDLQLNDAQGQPLSWIEGGEVIRLVIRARCNTEIDRPIMGFSIKDRLGQHIFGANSYLTYAQSPLSVKEGQEIVAEFSFTLPHLHSGEYSITVAIASGTPEQHVQHHWVHDALIFTIHSQYDAEGLIMAIPMQAITLEVLDNEAQMEGG
jgi:lipopolysaccharide transport system ATP-binding protein